MTIAGSGALVFPTELNTELKRTGALTMPDAITRWLAEEPTGPLTFPTDFYGKSAVKETDQAGPSATDNQHTFTSVDLGANFTGRCLKIVVFLATKLSATVPGTVNISSVTCAGTAVGGASDVFYYQGGAGSTDFLTVTLLDVPTSVTATSGTIEFATTIDTRAYIVVLSMSDTSISPTDGDGSAVASGTGTSVTLDIPTNGVLISAAIKRNTNAITMTNVTERDEFTLLTNYRCVYGWTNRLSSQSGRVVSFSSSGSAASVMGAASY